MNNFFIQSLNTFGDLALHFAWPMLWQSSLLIAALFLLDFALRRNVRAAVRYALWLVLLVKLLLPPSLALPTSIAWWLRPTSPAPILTQQKPVTITYSPMVLPAEPILFTPPRPPPRPKPHLSFSAIVLLFAFGASLALFVFMLFRWRLVLRHIHQTHESPDWLTDLLESTRCQLGLRQPIRLRLTDQSISPAVCGLFRPLILLPTSLAADLPRAQLRAVLLHELVHLRRCDVWINCAQSLLQIGYWWHPLLWLANARIRRLREEAVDDAVMLALREEADIYAPTLLEVAKLAFNRPLASLGLVGILETKRALRKRIERLVDFQAPRRAGMSIVSLFAVVAFTCLAVPQGEAPPKPALPSAESLSFNLTTETRSPLDSPFRPFGRTLEDELALETAKQTLRDFDHATEALEDLPAGGQADYLITDQSDHVVSPEAAKRSASLAEEAGVLFELNKLPQAAAKLDAALKLNPKNQAAYYYWDRLREEGYLPPRMRRFVTNSIGLPYFLVRLNGGSVAPTAAMLNYNYLSGQARASETLNTNLVFSNGENLLANQDGPGSSPAANRADRTSPESALLDSGNSRTNRAGDGVYRDPWGNPYIISRETSKSRQRIFRKLESIHLEQINFVNMPLSEVVKTLSAETRKHDPDGIGLNFILSPQMSSSGVAGIDPASGLRIPQPAPTEGPDIGAVRVKLALTFLDVRLRDLLDVIVNSADRPSGTLGIQYSIKDYGLVFSWKQKDMLELATRTFRLDPNTFKQGLERAVGAASGSLHSTNNARTDTSSLHHDPSDLPTVTTRVLSDSDINISSTIRRLFQSRGVDLSPPKALFWNDRQGTLLVRATLHDLDTIESTIQVLNTTPPQISIKATFIALPPKASPALWKSLGITNKLHSPESIVLSSTQAVAALKIIKSQKEVDILAESSVVTLAGRQAQLQIADAQTIVTGVTNGSKEPTFLTENVMMGPVLDVTPNFVPDTFAVQLQTVATVNEFLGYDDPKDKRVEVLVGDKPTRVKPPLPHFRTTQSILTNLTILDGQTLVLGNATPVEQVSGQIVKPVPKLEATRKSLVVFVTLTLVDPAGNRYYNEPPSPKPN